MTAPAPEQLAAGTLTGAAAGQVGQLVRAETSALTRISDQLVSGLLRLWSSFDGFYSDRAVVDFGARAGKLVVAAQKATGQVTEAHLRRQFTALGAPLPARPVVGLPTDLRFGALTVDVYQRPVRTVRYLSSVELDDGADQHATPDAVAGGQERLLKLAETDLQLAKTTAAQQVMYAAPETATAWRRIIHPEVSGQVCGLCIVAADRTYSRQELAALHPGCHCTVLPVLGDVDPGLSLNAEDLQRIYDAVGSTRAEDLRRTRVQVLEHGELGPVLVARPNPGQTPRTAADVERDGGEPAAELRRRTLTAQRDAIASQLDRLATDRDIRVGRRTTTVTDPGVAWLRDRLRLLDEQLAS